MVEKEENTTMKIHQLHDSGVSIENSKEDLIKLISKNTIIFVSVIFTPILGSIFLYYNFRKVKKNNLKSIILLIGYLMITFVLVVGYNILEDRYANYIQMGFVKLVGDESMVLKNFDIILKMAFKIFINTLFVHYIWNSVLGKSFLFKIKEVRVLVAVILFIYITLQLLKIFYF